MFSKADVVIFLVHLLNINLQAVEASRCWHQQTYNSSKNKQKTKKQQKQAGPQRNKPTKKPKPTKCSRRTLVFFKIMKTFSARASPGMETVTLSVMSADRPSAFSTVRADIGVNQTWVNYKSMSAVLKHR